MGYKVGNIGRATRRHGTNQLTRIGKEVGSILRNKNRREYLKQLGDAYLEAFDKQQELLNYEPSVQNEGQSDFDFETSGSKSRTELLQESQANADRFASEQMSKGGADTDFARIAGYSKILNGLKTELENKPIDMSFQDIIDDLDKNITGETPEERILSARKLFTELKAKGFDERATPKQNKQVNEIKDDYIAGLGSSSKETEATKKVDSYIGSDGRKRFVWGDKTETLSKDKVYSKPKTDKPNKDYSKDYYLGGKGGTTETLAGIEELEEQIKISEDEANNQNMIKTIKIKANKAIKDEKLSKEILYIDRVVAKDRVDPNKLIQRMIKARKDTGKPPLRQTQIDLLKRYYQLKRKYKYD